MRVLLQLLVNLGHSNRKRCPLHAVCAAEQKLRFLNVMHFSNNSRSHSSQEANITQIGVYTETLEGLKTP